MNFQIFLKNCKSESINQKFTEIINTLKNEIEIFKTQLSQLSTSPTISSDSSENRKLSKEIISNFKAHWDLKMLIKELEEENIQHAKNLNSYAREEQHTLLGVIKSNDMKKSKLLQDLYMNMKEKQRLQSKIMQIKDGSRKELLELQIQVRSLKLEKVQLMEKNSNIKKQAEIAQKENNEKDEIINQMKAEIEDMKKRLKRQKSAPNFDIPVSSPEFIQKNSAMEQRKKNPFHRPANSLHHARFVSKSKGKLTYFNKSIENFLKAYIGTKNNKENRSKTPLEYLKKTRPDKENIQVSRKNSNNSNKSNISPMPEKNKQSLNRIVNKGKGVNSNKTVLVPKDSNVMNKILVGKKFE